MIHVSQFVPTAKLKKKKGGGGKGVEKEIKESEKERKQEGKILRGLNKTT